MLLLVKIKEGYSADCVLIDNVTQYKEIIKGVYKITYKDPQNDYKLFDIYIKHVEEVKEVLQ